MTETDDELPARLTERPSWLINQISAYAHRVLSERLATEGSRGYHYRLLAALQEFGPASQAVLGRRAALDRSDVVATVNDLVARGMVERSPDPSDGRRNVITISTAGRGHLRRLDRLLVEVQDDLLEPLSPQERDLLTGMLVRMVEHRVRS